MIKATSKNYLRRSEGLDRAVGAKQAAYYKSMAYVLRKICFRGCLTFRELNFYA